MLRHETHLFCRVHESFARIMLHESYGGGRGVLMQCVHMMRVAFTGDCCLLEVMEVFESVGQSNMYWLSIARLRPRSGSSS